MTPKLKLGIVFWTITLPMVPIVLLMLLVAIILSPIPKHGNWFMSKTEHLITKFAIWRNTLPIVKNAYDKVYLFDYLKN